MKAKEVNNKISFHETGTTTGHGGTCTALRRLRQEDRV